MKTLIISILFSSAQSLASHPGEKSDFFITYIKSERVQGTNKSISKSTRKSLEISATDCRANIKTAICLVEPWAEGDTVETRKCLEGSQDYAIFFEQLYDQYPASLQKMFCSTKRIFIEKQFIATAYASIIKDEKGNNHGAFIGVRKSLLDLKQSLENWISWKEQLNFGGNYESYDLTPGLPVFKANTQKPVFDLLYFVMAHEFGHVFDFANNVNQLEDCSTDKDGDWFDCKVGPNSWTAFSWTSEKLVNNENDFTNRMGLCFYRCEDHPLKKEDVLQLYKDFNESNFISLYAATNPLDDFAEAMAYYVSDLNLQMTISLDTAQGVEYNMMEKLHSFSFSKKYEYVKNFLNRSDLIYP